MSDTNQLTPAPVQPQESATPAPVQATPDAPLSDRERIYAQYYQSQEAPAAAQPVETPAPVAAAPATSETPAPVAPTQDAVLATLLAEVQSLKAKLETPAPPTPPTALNPAEQKDWLALMAEGKRDEGEKFLAQKIEREISERIQAQALERMEANRSMYEFTAKIRTDNPDLVAMEDYIAYAAKARLDQAAQAGKIRTPADYAKVYQESVTAEVEKARNLANTLRGVGKNEALTRSREVVSTQTLQPQAINQNREAPANAAPPTETVEDYFAARQRRSLQGRGLSVG